MIIDAEKVICGSFDGNVTESSSKKLFIRHAKLSKARFHKQSHVIKVDLIYARPAVLWMESGRDKTHS